MGSVSGIKRCEKCGVATRKLVDSVCDACLGGQDEIACEKCGAVGEGFEGGLCSNCQKEPGTCKKCKATTSALINGLCSRCIDEPPEEGFTLNKKQIFLTPIYCAVISLVPLSLPLMATSVSYIDLFLVGWLISIPLGIAVGFREIFNMPIKQVIILTVSQIVFFFFCGFFLIDTLGRVPTFYSEVAFTISLAAILFRNVVWKKVILFFLATVLSIMIVAYFDYVFFAFLLAILYFSLGIKIFFFENLPWSRWVRVTLSLSIIYIGCLGVAVMLGEVIR